MTTDWFWKTIGRSHRARRFKSRGLGCASLVDTAIRAALLHNRCLTPESLQEVPWSVGELLWRKLVSSLVESIHSTLVINL